MNRLLDMANKLKGVDLNKMLDEVLNDLLPQIIDRVLEQLEEGKFKDKVAPSYQMPSGIDYMKEKSLMGSYNMSILPAMNLKYSGKFHEGFYAIVREKIIEIGSKDSKADNLEYNYGSSLYELGTENMDWLINDVRPELQRLSRVELGI